MKIVTPELDKFLQEEKPSTLSKPAVAELQRLLAILGLYLGTIDGLYGPVTARAMAASQDDQATVALSHNAVRGLKVKAGLLGGPYPYDLATKEGCLSALTAECKLQEFTLPQTAYARATCLWETNNTCQPVREAYWLKDPDSYRKKLRYYPYDGRGLIQLTWEANYRKYGELLQLPLVKEPDLTLQPEVAIFIAVHGLKTGAFTGKKISDYVNAFQRDYRNARRCVNGLDKADEIAALAKKQFELLVRVDQQKL